MKNGVKVTVKVPDRNALHFENVPVNLQGHGDALKPEHKSWV